MKRLSRILPAVTLAFLSLEAAAQGQGEVYKYDTTWKVYANSVEKTLGFSGGFNNPQFSLGDLNNDGRRDLVVFEKGSMQIKTFVNYGTAGSPDYRYRPQYEKHFPEKNGQRAVGSYMKMEDLNCDDIPDVITRGLGGFSVYYGYYSNNELRFNYYKDLYYSPLVGNSESFESPFQNVGWKTKNQGWSRQTSGINPSVSPQHGSWMAAFEASTLPGGEHGAAYFQVFPDLPQSEK